MRLYISILGTASLFAPALATIPAVFKPLDAITYFCSRWEHASIIKNDVLYINGGAETFNYPFAYKYNWTNNTYWLNTFLLEYDLKASWDWKKNISYSAFEKTPNPQTGTEPPNFIRGTMFQGPANDSKIYAYGGTTFTGNTSSSVNRSVAYSQQYSLWSFDVESTAWDQWDLAQEWRPNFGASAEAYDQGLAFYLNGQIDNGTDSGTLEFGDTTIYVDGMLVIDLVRETAVNISTNGIKDYLPRVGGGLQYVPGVGNNGVLVAIGGQVDEKSRISSATSGSLLNFTTVDVFDIGSYISNPGENGTWYSQTTTGDIPLPRTGFCTVLISAPDNSSHNIYLYGGHNPLTTTMYDEVHILSLPTFTWTRIFSGKSPRWGHTCHLVGQRQMLTVGGQTFNDTQKGCDWERMSVAIYDMTNLTWGSVYDAKAAPWELPGLLSQTLVATKAEPVDGWDEPGLKKVMSKKRIWSAAPVTLNPHSKSSKNHTSKGVIIGATIGSVVFVALVGFVVFFLYPRLTASKQRFELDGTQKQELSHDSEKKNYELQGTAVHAEMSETCSPAEAPRDTATHAVELPATNVQEGGLWGVPIVRTPSQEVLPNSPSATDEP